jgi:hypothetical protein
MKLRERDLLTPEMARELAALDAALAGESVDEDLASLGELAVALRSERPVPGAGFVERLDREAEKGFRREPRPRPFGRVRVAPLALGSAASIFIAAVAILSSGVLSGGGKDENGSPVPVPAAQPAAREGKSEAKRGGSAVSTGPAAPSGRVSPPSGVSAAPDLGARRKVERSANLVLATPPRSIEDVADGAIRVTDRYGGFVMNSSVSSGEGEAAGASLDLRIPSSRLQAALGDLSKLAHVRSRTQASSDITAQFSGPRRRLANALSERKALLRLLAKATTPNETASIRARLRLADRRIDRARSALRRLDTRIGLAAVGVNVEPGSETNSGNWTPGEAVGDAVSVLGAVLGALIISLAVAVPLALAGLVILAVRRSFVRHARERALDA